MKYKLLSFDVHKKPKRDNLQFLHQQLLLSSHKHFCFQINLTGEHSVQFSCYLSNITVVLHYDRKCQGRNQLIFSGRGQND